MEHIHGASCANPRGDVYYIWAGLTGEDLMRQSKHKDIALATAILVASLLIVLIGTKMSVDLQHAYLSSLDMLQ